MSIKITSKLLYSLCSKDCKSLSGIAKYSVCSVLLLISVASIIRKHKISVHIVFITGLSGHMPEAFRVHAYDYILKPISSDNVYRVLDDLLKPTSKLTIVADRREVSIPTSKILYIESMGKKAAIKTTDLSVSVK